MSFKTTIKTKYTTIQINDDHDGAKMFTWASVGLAYMDSAPQKAKLFGHLFDDKLIEVLRDGLKAAVDNPERDIRLEDVDVLINFAEGKKHLAVQLPALVSVVEDMFDAECEPKAVFVK